MWNTHSLEVMTKAVAEVVKDHVRKAFAVLAARLDAIDKRLAEMPIPKDGIDGKDGKDAEPVDQKAIVDAVLARMPAPEPGVPGVPGKDGENGKDGQDGASVSLDDVKALLEPELAKWELDFERRAQDLLQKAIDRMPPPKDGADGTNGKDGVDGLGFDDLDVEYDGERSFTISFQRGDQVKAFAFRAPVVIDRGVFKEGSQYETGDGVTWGRHYWIAQKDTTGKPEPGSDWRLAVKSGRDGKDGRDGIDMTKAVKLP
jgi:integrin beta 3